MKKGMKLGLGTAVLLAAGALIAQEQTQTFNSAADWKAHPPKLQSAISEADGMLTVKGPAGVMLIGKKFKIDPAKKYTLKLSVQANNAEGKVSSLVFAGFNVFDEKGRQINSNNVCIVAGTLTEVAADAAKGSKVIAVKDGSKFKTGYKSIVTNAKEDLSDLPNFNVLGDVKAVEQKGDVWEITLTRPLSKDIKAGTMIREHFQNGFLYTAGARGVGQQLITMKGTITGENRGIWKSTAWPTGAVTAQIIILTNWQHKKIDTQFKDITLTVE